MGYTDHEAALTSDLLCGEAPPPPGWREWVQGPAPSRLIELTSVLGQFAGYHDATFIMSASRPQARPGRPRGSANRVVTPSLGRHHFAYLRARAEGVPGDRAASLYLSDDAHGAALAPSLLRSVLDRVRSLSDELRTASDLVEAPSPAAKVVPVMTLDEFIESSGEDPDFFSESEWIDRYQAAVSSRDGIVRAVDIEANSAAPVLNALRLIERTVAREPRPNDRVDQWLVPNVSRRLEGASLVDVAALARLVAARGRAWTRSVPGIGQVQGSRIEAWLAHTGTAASQPEGRPRPLDDPWWDTTGEPAKVDRQAVKAWLETCPTGSSTQRAYRKEVERLFLWSWLVRYQPLESSIEALDDYCAWLRSPAPDWIDSTPWPRHDSRWRPFRAPLGGASVALARKVTSLFAVWLRDGSEK